ncbi:protein SYS1 homolog [Zingiber officinale]|uniref:protein SYS1 homolog n=1 Tax=Zingiber officinale TaxID=94328 RepID=UPI001C4D1FE0|nr:protein SYS1 homolog [Zingiber officinale]
MHALIRLFLCFSARAILKFGDSDRYLKVVKRLGSGTRRRGIMFYGTIVWDPWLILAQIVSLQCLYYLTLGFFMVLLVGTRVSWMSLMYFFDFSMLVASTVTGWCAIVSFILSSLAGAVFLLYLIERAKKCLDFSATLYIIHLFISIIYGGWPSSITWWVVNIIGLALMSLLGEWLCIRREMQEIPITRLRSNV